MRVVDIIEGTSVDGPGLRTSIYLAGCLHRCNGCHNPSTWAFDSGSDYPIEALLQVVDSAGWKVTLSGGDPMYQAEEVAELCRQLKDRGYNVWLYTGFTLEQVLANEQMRRVLEHIDVLVDGPYVESLRDTDLRFRGSSNQRLIDVPPTLATARVVEWSD